jgi:SAM-dependent methyltransferase
VSSKKSAASAKRRTAQAKKPRALLSARNADKHVLYQRAVQAPEIEVEFIADTYAEVVGRKALSVREDFCGTALFCAEWVKSDPERNATGVDIDPDVLAWGREHNIEPLAADAERVTLLQEDVRTAQANGFDVVTAFNFSYWIFGSRDELRRYFAAVHASLLKDGLFFLDAYGGWESWQPMEERRNKGNFTYIWDQSEVNPIDNTIVNFIHFEFRDGTKLRKAFEYRWRFWTLPEIRELLLEAGFSEVSIYWDISKDDSKTVYRPRKVAENQPGWLAYIVARP